MNSKIFKTAMMLTAALAMTASVLFTSCKKDEPQSVSLAGTIWAWQNMDNGVSAAVKFTSEKDALLRTYIFLTIPNTETPCTYTYQPPKISLVMHFTQSDTTIVGKITDDFYLDLGDLGIFTKTENFNF